MDINPDTNRIACNLCDKTYGGKDRYGNFRSHIDTIHMEKYLSCRFCKKEFFSIVTFLRHYQNHLSKEKFNCEICGTKGGSKTGLSLHMATVHLHQKNFKCELCDNSYGSKTYLIAHIQSKHSDRNFPCEY